MRLDYLFLADRVEPGATGVAFINAYGIGMNDYLFSAFPSAVPATWLVAGFMIEPGEFDTDHAIEMEFWNPDGVLLPRTGIGTMRLPPHDLDPDARVRFHNCTNIAGLPFPKSGPYEIRVFVNGEQYGALTINARHDPTLTAGTPGVMQVPPVA
jgi:hypothetical protein